MTVEEKIYCLLVARESMDEASEEYRDFFQLVFSPEDFFGRTSRVNYVHANRGDDVPSDFSKQRFSEGGFSWESRGAISPDFFSSDCHHSHRDVLKSEFWEFHFYLARHFSNKTAKKLEEIKKEVSEKDISTNFLEGEFENLCKKVKRIPSNEQNGVNLICCHGPITQNIREIGSMLVFSCRQMLHINSHYHFSEDEPFLFCRFCESHGFYGINCHTYHQMLTGDARLVPVCSYEKHFSSLLEKILLFQVPHHGSKNSWKKSLGRAFHRNCQHWVVTHDEDWCFKGKGFPHTDFGDLPVRDVTERCSFGLKFTMFF